MLVTAPVDRRLVTGAHEPAAAPPAVRAKVLGDAPIEAVELRLDDGAWRPMAPAAGGGSVWQAALGGGLAPQGGRITVRARDAMGREDADAVEPAGAGWVPPRRHADGSDADRIGAWPEKGILGTQLGPNRNGRKW